MDFKASGNTPPSGEAQINALLSPAATGTEVADLPAGDTPMDGQETVTEVDDGAEFAEEAGAEEAADESADQGGEEAETEEEELRVSDLETDYSEDAYSRAAAHYNKHRSKPLDPNDPDDRWTLKELMDRGRKIEELQAPKDEADAEESDEGAEAEDKTKADTQPAKTPAEMIQERLKGASEYAKANIVPEVAKQFASELVDALWPGKGVGEKITQEQANQIATVFSTFAIMQIADAIPSILDNVPRALGSKYPQFDRMHDMATREAAVDELLDAKDAKGTVQFPHLEQLVDSGAIKRAMNSPELKDAVFSKDPYKNLVAKMKVAYRMARNERVDPAMLEKATQRGRQQAADRARAVGAGKLPSGKSKGGFVTGDPNKDFVNNLTSGSGSKFSKALADSKK